MLAILRPRPLCERRTSAGAATRKWIGRAALRATPIAMLALAVRSAPAHAQRAESAPAALRAGTLVRIETARGSHTGVLTRDLIISRGDTAVIMPCSTCGEERFLLDSVNDLHVRSGSNRAAHAGAGALLGAVAGGLLGGALGSHAAIGPGHPNGSLAPLTALVGAGAGALGGSIIGLVVPARGRWEEVDIPPSVKDIGARLRVQSSQAREAAAF